MSFSYFYRQLKSQYLFKRNYPFDPVVIHHVWLSLGLALWIILFLILTEPLDTNQFETSEKFIFLPIYGIAGALAYLIILPLQRLIYRKGNGVWMYLSEIVLLVTMILLGLILSRSVYLYVIVPGTKYPYTLGYFTTAIYLPAIATIMPILFLGRWAIGRYYEKKLDDQKIEIEGEGTYEGLRLQRNDLILVKADDNYVEVTYMDHGHLKKQLIRSTLSKVSIMVPELLRSHRSYLFNPYYFQKFSMEKGKLQVFLGNDIAIPVSKTYTDSVKNKLGQL